MGVSFLGERRELRLPGLLYADGLVLCGESEEDLKVMVGHFVEVCRRRGLKVNADKSNVVLGGDEGLGCEIHMDGALLERVSGLNESGTDVAECIYLFIYLFIYSQFYLHFRPNAIS